MLLADRVFGTPEVGIRLAKNFNPKFSDAKWRMFATDDIENIQVRRSEKFPNALVVSFKYQYSVDLLDLLTHLVRSLGGGTLHGNPTERISWFLLNGNSLLSTHLEPWFIEDTRMAKPFRRNPVPWARILQVPRIQDLARQGLSDHPVLVRWAFRDQDIFADGGFPVTMEIGWKEVRLLVAGKRDAGSFGPARMARDIE